MSRAASKQKSNQPLSPSQKNSIKSELFTSLSKLGLQEQLKKQLRIQICEQLKQKDLLTKQQSHEDKLYNRIIASLVSELLLRNDCGYANSVYVVESGYDMKTLTRAEVAEIMGFRDHDLDDKWSLLENIVKRKYPFSGGTFRSVAVQTKPEEVGYTLEQRLSLIDQEYRRNITSTSPNKQEAEYKKKIEQLEFDLRRNYERDMDRFKQFEAHSIKVKTSQEWRKKFEAYANSLSEEYRRKMDNLRKKQGLLEQDIINKNKVLDEKVNGSHKALLQKLDILDIKSSTVDETTKNLEIERKRAKEQFAQAERQLREKTRQYDNLLLNLNSKIEYQVGVAKLAIEQEYQDKNAEFLARKKFVDEQYGKIMGIKDTTDIIKEESKRLFEENMRLRTDLTQLEKELRLAVSEGATQGERLDVLRTQFSKVERTANQKEETLRDLEKRLKRREQDIIEMRKQLDDLRIWKQNHEQHSSRQMSLSEIGGKPSIVSISEPKSQLQIKMDALKKQRKREIEKLKLQLIS